MLKIGNENMETNTERDKILTSILQCRFKAITQEMGYTLLRTTRSPILNEARDFVTGIYDARGRMLEQAEYIPVLAFALQPVCRKIIAYFGDDIHPGDVILHNDVMADTPPGEAVQQGVLGWVESRL